MSRASKKDREEFVAVLTRECPDKDPVRVAQIAGAIMRLGATMNKLATEECNGDDPLRKVDYDAWRTMLDNRIMATKKKLSQAVYRLGFSLPESLIISRDPRGYTVKLLLPSGRYNTWGGKEDGWGVPTS